MSDRSGDLESEGVSDRVVASDILATVGVVVLSSILVSRPFPSLAPFRILVGLVSVLFAPGYVTLLATLSASGSTGGTDKGGADVSDPHGENDPNDKPSPVLLRTTTEMDRVEWATLAVLFSLVIVPVLGVGASLVGLDITPLGIVLLVNAYTVVLAGVAVVRRLGTDSRGPFSLRRRIVSWGGRIRTPPSRVDAALNIGLAILIVAGGVAVVVDDPDGTTQFTEFYLLHSDQSDDPTMSEFLSTTEPGEPERIQAGITNHENQRQQYSVVVQLQRAVVTERSVRVVERRQLDEFDVELAHNETARVSYDVLTSEAQTGCRIAFLLYRGSAPEQPTADEAYRELHLWHAEEPPNPEGSCPALDAVDMQVNATRGAARLRLPEST